MCVFIAENKVQNVNCLLTSPFIPIFYTHTHTTVEFIFFNGLLTVIYFLVHFSDYRSPSIVINSQHDNDTYNWIDYGKEIRILNKSKFFFRFLSFLLSCLCRRGSCSESRSSCVRYLLETEKNVNYCHAFVFFSCVWFFFLCGKKILPQFSQAECSFWVWLVGG